MVLFKSLAAAATAATAIGTCLSDRVAGDLTRKLSPNKFQSTFLEFHIRAKPFTRNSSTHNINDICKPYIEKKIFEAFKQVFEHHSKKKKLPKYNQSNTLNNTFDSYLN